MIDLLRNIFSSSDSRSVSEEEKRAQREDQRAKNLELIRTQSMYLHKLSKQLQHVRPIVERVVFYTNKLTEHAASDDNIVFLLTYLPKIIKITEEQVKFRLEDSNDLHVFWNLIQSKDILLRFSNALSDKQNSVDKKQNADFSADLSAMDAILKMRGY